MIYDVVTHLDEEVGEIAPPGLLNLNLTDRLYREVKAYFRQDYIHTVSLPSFHYWGFANI